VSLEKVSANKVLIFLIPDFIRFIFKK